MADDNGPKVVDESFPGWLVPAMALLGFLALANLWIGLKNSSYTEDSRHALNSDMQTLKLGHAKDLSSVQQRLAQAEKANADLQDDFRVVAKRLQITQGQLKKAREEAQRSATTTRYNSRPWTPKLETNWTPKPVPRT